MAKEPLPYSPPDYEPADATAFQALQRGDASESQQKRALDWLVNKAAGTYDMDYRQDPRDHAFVSGRRSCLIRPALNRAGAAGADGANENGGSRGSRRLLQVWFGAGVRQRAGAA